MRFIWGSPINLELTLGGALVGCRHVCAPARRPPTGLTLMMDANAPSYLETMRLVLAGTFIAFSRRVVLQLARMAWHDKQGNAQDAWNCLKTYHGAERC